MTPDQIPQLLKQVSYADPRLLPEDRKELAGLAALWAGVLADVPADFAMHAVGQHYAQSPFPIKPSDIASRWQTVVRERMNRDIGTFEPHTHPGLDPDDVPGYLEALRKQRQAVVLGQQQPAEVRAITAGPAAAEAKRRLQALGTYVPRTVADALSAHRPVRAERERLARSGQPDPLTVACPWCNAPAGEPCRAKQTRPNGEHRSKRLSEPHPSRTDLVTQPGQPATA
ncbi:zinc finger domain-containing protein [Streptomyces sp. QTS137]